MGESDHGGSYAHEQEVYKKSLHLPLSFVLNLTLLWKKKKSLVKTKNNNNQEALRRTKASLTLKFW